MKISIIIAVYNGAKTLQTCMNSIVGQTYKNREVVIMDGGSEDATVEILEKNTNSIFYWESEKDRGIAHAWNKALDHITGDWVIFLGADDRFQDDRVLSDMAEIMRGSRVDDVIYGQIIYEGGAAHGLVFGGKNDLNFIKRRMAIPHTATFHRRGLFTEVGPFDENYKIAIDYEYFLRKRALQARFVHRRIVVMGGDGVSSRLVRRALQEFRHAQIKNKTDWRIKIEVWHAYYQLRHRCNLWRAKWVSA